MEMKYLVAILLLVVCSSAFLANYFSNYTGTAFKVISKEESVVAPIVQTAQTPVPVKKTSYIYSNDLNAKFENDVLKYYHQDNLGSNSLTTASGGAESSDFKNEPYGKAMPSEKSDAQESYKYTGKELDTETDLYYYGARYYDTDTGRFINVDPILRVGSNYAYAANNPMIMVDERGMAETTTAPPKINWYSRDYSLMGGYNYPTGLSGAFNARYRLNEEKYEKWPIGLSLGIGAGNLPATQVALLGAQGGSNVKDWGVSLNGYAGLKRDNFNYAGSVAIGYKDWSVGLFGGRAQSSQDGEITISGAKREGLASAYPFTDSITTDFYGAGLYYNWQSPTIADKKFSRGHATLGAGYISMADKFKYNSDFGEENMKSTGGSTFVAASGAVNFNKKFSLFANLNYLNSVPEYGPMQTLLPAASGKTYKNYPSLAEDSRPVYPFSGSIGLKIGW